MRSGASASVTGALPASTRTGAETGSVGRRRRRPGNAARTVPAATSSPPTQSHTVMGISRTPKVTWSSAAEDGLRRVR